MEFVSTQYDKLIFNNQMKYILNVLWLSIKLIWLNRKFSDRDSVGSNPSLCLNCIEAVSANFEFGNYAQSVLGWNN